jgi:hypothetical protein
MNIPADHVKNGQIGMALHHLALLLLAWCQADFLSV